jgi:tetratricopeptide (TPR) repeat protein
MKRVLPALLLLLGLTGALAQSPAQDPLVAKAGTALVAKNWQEAEAALKQLAAIDPANLDYQVNLVAAQFAQGHNDDALASCDKAIATAQKRVGAPSGSDEKTRIALGNLLTTKGNILTRQKKYPEAIAAYQKAAAVDPHPAVAYFNICAVSYNQGDTKGAVACDKAIAADPNKADAYFIKGSVLFADSTTQKRQVGGAAGRYPGAAEIPRPGAHRPPRGRCEGDAQGGRPERRHHVSAERPPIGCFAPTADSNLQTGRRRG